MPKRSYRLSEADRRERSKRMKRLNADPEFAAAASERMKRRQADPEFAAKKAAASEHMKRLNADPEAIEILREIYMRRPAQMITTQKHFQSLVSGWKQVSASVCAVGTRTEIYTQSGNPKILAAMFKKNGKFMMADFLERKNTDQPQAHQPKTHTARMAQHVTHAW